MGSFHETMGIKYTTSYQISISYYIQLCIKLILLHIVSFWECVFCRIFKCCKCFFFSTFQSWCFHTWVQHFSYLNFYIFWQFWFPKRWKITFKQQQNNKKSSWIAPLCIVIMWNEHILWIHNLIFTIIIYN